METLIDKDTIDLKKKYKFDYSLDTPYEDDKANKFNEEFFLNLYIATDNFNFSEKKKKLIEKSQQKKAFLKLEEFKCYEEKIKVIEEMFTNLTDQISTSYMDYFLLINDFNVSYENNEERPGALITYNKIMIDILGSISEKCIYFEKKLIKINNLMNEINHCLN